MTDKPLFRVIDGTPAPDTPKERRLARLRKSKPPELIRCHRCQSSAMTQIRLGMMLSNGKATGGAKQTVCASCLAGGQIVTVVI